MLSTIILLTVLVLTVNSAITIASVPELKVTNLSNQSLTFTLQQLQTMPQTTVNAELYCYGSLVTSGDWTGVRLSYLLAEAQVTPETLSVQFKAADGYKVTIPIDLAQDSQTIIAYEKDNQPLSEDLRLILPGINGAAWIAQITSIEMQASLVQNPETIGTAANNKPPESNNLNTTTTITPTQQPTTQQQPTATPNLPEEKSIPTNDTKFNSQIPTLQLANNDGTFFQFLFLSVSIFFFVLLVSGLFVYKRKYHRKQHNG